MKVPQWTCGVAVVIPSYRVRRHILDVLKGLGPDVDAIYVVDDKCPENSGAFVEANCADPRVRVLHNAVNLGVGGATLRGMQSAFADGATVCVKMDGDGQMDSARIGDLVSPILLGDADYAKGNRFFDLTNIGSMPRVRIVGNAALSFLSKISSGYWDIFDPTNGFVAMHRSAFLSINPSKVSSRFFFESDMLFRLYLARAVVIDVPMDARYGDEKTNLMIRRVILPFLAGHVRNFAKRVFYTYFLRDFSIASIYITVGPAAVLFGLVFGVFSWIDLAMQGIPASAGTVMLAALPVALGAQFLISFFASDMSNVPSYPLQRRVRRLATAALPSSGRAA